MYAVKRAASMPVSGSRYEGWNQTVRGRRRSDARGARSTPSEIDHDDAALRLLFLAFGLVFVVAVATGDLELRALALSLLALALPALDLLDDEGIEHSHARF